MTSVLSQSGSGGRSPPYEQHGHTPHRIQNSPRSSASGRQPNYNIISDSDYCIKSFFATHSIRSEAKKRSDDDRAGQDNKHSVLTPA